MAITAISRDWGVSPSIVRITTTDDLAEITTAGYLTAQDANIQALQNGEFEWVPGDFVAIYYDGGQGFFSEDPVNLTFISIPGAGGELSDALPSSQIFVGSAGNIATPTAVTGVLAITNTGVTTLNANSVLKGALSFGIQASHIVVYAAKYTTVGGAAAEAIAIAGVFATDLAFVQLNAPGTNGVSVLHAVTTANTLTVTFSADPGNNAVIYYQILRATV